jgi:hypothetical protein
MRLIVLALLLAFGSQSFATAYDIIIVAGQSNACGFGLGPFHDPDSTPETNARIFQLGRYLDRDMQIIPGTDTLENWMYTPEWPRLGMTGGTTAFARQYVKSRLADGRQVLLIPGAYPGVSITDWMDVTTNLPGDAQANLYGDLRSRVNTVLAVNPGSKIVSLYWHQGETDIVKIEMNDGEISSGAVYEQRLSILMDRFRHDFGPDFPIVLGDFVATWNTGSPAKKDVQDAVQRVIGSHAGLHFVLSAGLPSNTDTGASQDPDENVHFNAQAQIDFGKRYFEAWNKAVSF